MKEAETQLKLVEKALVRTGRRSHLRLDRAPQLARIRRGYALDLSAFGECIEPWDAARLITQARVLACLHARSKVGVPRLTGEAALVALGWSAWLSAPDVRFSRHPSVSRVVQLPSVEVGEHLVPSAKEIPTSGEIPTFDGNLRLADSENSRCEEFRASSPLLRPSLDTVKSLGLGIALNEHPLVAVVGLSSLLTRVAERGILAAPDKAGRPATHSPDPVEELREFWLHTLSNKDNSQWRRRMGQACVAAARSGIESPGEGFLLWTLGALLPEKTACELQTQVEVDVRSSSAWGSRTRTRRVDVALPAHKIAFEFDGASKLAERYSRQDFLSRQRELRSLGWQSIHVDWRMARDPVQAATYVASELRSLGVRLRSRPGVLWKPIAPELTDPARLWGVQTPSSEHARSSDQV